MDKNQVPKKLVTLAQLTKLADVSAPRIAAIRDVGGITPDFISTSGEQLFKAEKVEALVKIIRNYGLAKFHNR